MSCLRKVAPLYSDEIFTLQWGLAAFPSDDDPVKVRKWGFEKPPAVTAAILGQLSRFCSGNPRRERNFRKFGVKFPAKIKHLTARNTQPITGIKIHESR